MKGFNVMTFALLASAALGFGQTTYNQPPTGPAAGSQNATYTAPPAQRNRPDMISPGTINYLEGQVAIDNRALQTNQSVVLQPNQTLSTGNGFAEVLLTPGTFLRVGHNSQVRLVTAGLADTKAQLDRGTALVEVDQLIKGTNLAVLVNGTTAQIEKKGLYDFDADQQAVRVLDGKLNVIEAGGSKSIGRNDQLLLSGPTPLKKVDFDTKIVKTQPLYVWSQARSQTESQANVAVAQNVGAYGGWAGPGWYWDPYFSSYSYLPASGLLYSPFGWGFYSPAFIGYYGVPFGGYYGYGRVGYYGGYGRYGAYHGRVGGFSAHVNSFHGGVGGGGFHGGGFHGGGHR